MKKVFVLLCLTLFALPAMAVMQADGMAGVDNTMFSADQARVEALVKFDQVANTAGDKPISGTEPAFAYSQPAINTHIHSDRCIHTGMNAKAVGKKKTYLAGVARKGVETIPFEPG